MTAGIVMFRAEHGRNFKNAFIHRHHCLLIQLGGLRKVYLLAKIIQLEYVCTALCPCKVDLRRMNLGKALFRQKFTETSLDPLLQFKNRAFLGITQRDRTIIELGRQVAVDLLFRDNDGGDLCGVREQFDAVNLQFVALTAILSFPSDHLTRDLRRAFLFHVLGHSVIGKALRIHALNHLSCRTQNDERKIRHHTNVVNRTLDGDHLVFIFFKIGKRNRIFRLFTRNNHKILSPLEISIFFTILF